MTTTNRMNAVIRPEQTPSRKTPGRSLLAAIPWCLAVGLAMGGAAQEEAAGAGADSQLEVVPADTLGELGVDHGFQILELDLGGAAQCGLLHQILMHQHVEMIHADS